MASGANPAILIFPTGIGTDIYSTKVDQGTVLTETHTTPIAPNSGIYFSFFTNHIPLFNNGILGSTTSIPDYTEAVGTPGASTYVVTYSGNLAGSFLVTAGNTSFPVTYTAAGDTIVAEWFNSLQTSVTGIEAYLLSGNATAVQVTGGSMTGNLTMNGGSVFTAVSGTNQVGSIANPFANVVSDEITTSEIASPDDDDTILLGVGLVASGNGAAVLVSDMDVTVSGGNSATLVGMTSGVFITAGNDLITMDGDVVPTGSYSYDLGSPSQRWRTAYVNSIDAISSAYVPTTGGTMTGPLTMAPGQAINTDFINNTAASLTVTSSQNINLNAPSGNVNINSNFSSINNNLLVTPTTLTVSSNILPNTSGNLNIGSPSASFGTIYANAIVGAAASGAFVAVTGDSMSGNLTMSLGTKIFVGEIDSATPDGAVNIDAAQINLFGTDNVSINLGSGLTNIWDFGLTQITQAQTILPAVSGLYDIGSAGQPLRALYADNLFAKSIGSGLVVASAQIGNIVVTGSVVYGPGVTVTNQSSGTVNLGSPSDPFGTIYATTVITSTSSGTFLSKLGDTMIGQLALGTGSNITAVGSGVDNMGSISNPLGTIYAQNVFGANLDNRYVAVTGDTMTGPLTISNIMSTGNLSITVGSGIVNITGSYITETAQNITLTSTVGPIIIGANSELQLGGFNDTSLVLNSSGSQSFNNIFPNTSGSYSLGTPQLPWGNIYAQNIIPIGSSGTGTFLLLIGGTMFGDIVLSSGVNIDMGTSGANNIGSPADPLGTLYVNNIDIGNPQGGFVHVTGDDMTGPLFMGGPSIIAVNNINGFTSGGTITIGSGAASLILDPNPMDTQHIIMPSGGSITIADTLHPLVIATSGIQTSGNIFPTISGNASIGTLALPYSGLYATTLVGQTLTVGTIANSNVSGVGNIGSASNPYNEVYTKFINGVPFPTPAWNEVPSGTVNSVNITFTTQFIALPGTQRLYRAGLRMTPSGVAPNFDYAYSGNTITFVNAPISGDNLLIDYSHL